MHLTIYIFGLFFYIANIVASSEPVDSEKSSLLTKKIQKAYSYTYILYIPIVMLNSGKIILPTTQYSNIQTVNDREEFNKILTNCLDVKAKSIIYMHNDVHPDLLEKLDPMKVHIKNYIVDYKRIFNIVLATYMSKDSKMTYQSFWVAFLHKVIEEEKIPQTFIATAIEELRKAYIKKIQQKKERTTLQRANSKHDDIKDKLFGVIRDDIINAIQAFIFYLTSIKEYGCVERYAKYQEKLGEYISARVRTEEEATILFERREKKEYYICQKNIAIQFKANLWEVYRLYHIDKIYGPAMTGEILVNSIYRCNLMGYTLAEIFEYANCMSKTWEKKEKERQKTKEDRLNSLVFKESQAAEIENPIQEEGKNAQEIATKEFERKREEAYKQQEEEEEERQRQRQRQLEAEEEKNEEEAAKKMVNPKQMVFDSSSATNIYIFHPRVSRWSTNDLDALQKSLNKSIVLRYHDQDRASLVSAKYLHDIFPVVRIFISKYRDEFFSENDALFNRKMYIAEGVMTIKDHTEGSIDKIMKGQVEIGLSKSRKRQIYHLYFKHALEKAESSLADSSNRQALDREESDNVSQDDFTYSGSLIYAADFIREKEDGDILIVFPNSGISGHPIVTRTLLLKKKNNTDSKKKK
ncbi:hypothetical protein NEFER03_1105 [Nematocida sp. LUAm3]|nr:hypothetical protein NEFER03_1105 [Nematocida sp. LUAm3]KAI5175290.1 hypothetical protein NEFER02_1219 [Nematocida sp. LUAm2]KAI5177753.1 hypothetical protein NEFER01_0977 [Nematocida sp. LUAm1]